MLGYREILSREFERRLQKNAQYSLRAFARDLDLSPGFLSQVLAAKKKLGLDRASDVAAKLSCSAKHKTLFLNQVRLEHAKSDGHKAAIRREMERAPGRMVNYRILDRDTFQVVANWYFHALLALADVVGFKSETRWMADRLGLPAQQIEKAVEILQRLGLFKREADGRLKSRGEMLKVEAVPSRAIREHHRQFLDLAKEALETQSSLERDFSGSNFAINPERLPEAKRLIREFRESMVELLDDPGRNTEVYRLSVQLFRARQVSADEEGEK